MIQDTEYEEFFELAQLIEASDSVRYFRFKRGDCEIEIRKDDLGEKPSQLAVPASSGPASQNIESNADTVAVSGISSSQVVADANAVNDDVIVIRSPMVGIFYRAPTPGEKPFVEIGDSVSADTTLCIIEVMKLMNSIPAGRTGVVTKILMENAEPVQFNQALFEIRKV